MSKMKKLLVIFLSLAMVIGTLTVTDVFAANNPTIYVEEQTAFTGKTVDVNVSITDNPGILGATLKVEFGEGLTLQSATSGEAFDSLVMTKPGQLVSGCNFVWDGQEISEEDIKDGVILTLTFEVAESANANEIIDIEVSCESGAIVDADLNEVQPTFVNGGVIPMNFMYGDLNSDLKINTTDIILLRRFIAGGYELDINESAADVNQQGTQKGKVNSSDIVILRRYIAGGYGIDSLPYPVTHIHTLRAVDYKASTCEEEGNIAYWYCASCGKYYSDSACTREIESKDTVIEKARHTIVVVPGKAATTTETGLTDGKKCSVCGYWEEEQEIIEKIEEIEVSVKYNLGDTRDSYLATQTIVNNNPDKFDSTKGLTLQNLEDTIPGYTFLGWYDGFGDNAEQVKKLAANEYEAGSTVQLYAHWELATYNVTYVCGDNMNPQHGDDYLDAKYATYKTSTGLVLPKIGIDKYYFVGWTTENGSGDVITKIEPGTTGDITLYANWTSYRSNAVQKTNYGDPIIVKDPDAGQIVFAYEIGQLNNVPLYEYFKLQAVGGVISSHSETVTVQLTETEAKNVTSAISLATINSQTWGLSSDWNEVTTVDETSAEEHGKTVEEAEEECKTTTDGYSLTSATGGSSSVTNSSSTSSTLSGSQSSNTFSENSEDSAYKLTNKSVENNSQEASVTAGLSYGVASVSATAKVAHSTTDTNTSMNSGNTHSYNSQTDNSSSAFSDTSTSSSASSSSSNWSSSEAYTSSNSISKSSSVSNTLSTVIANELHYGESISNGGSNYENRAESNEQHTTDSYSNTLTYAKMEAKEVTKSFATTGATTGDYRLVEAGTVHVFGVVAYDVATATFSVYTYNVLDDETYEYLDYSTDGSFDDYEYGCLSFDVPFLPYQYVTVKTFMTTDGLTINDEGVVTSYTGNDTMVYVPTYYRRYNETSQKYEYIKVVGIADGVFTGNENITGIVLGDYVESIGDNAFKGCTNLATVSCSGLKTIGKSAFEGCVALGSYIENEETKFGDFNLANGIESIGDNAFKDVKSIVVNASSKKVALEAAKSGAKNIKINLEEVDPDEVIEDDFELTIGDTVESVIIDGSGKTFTDLKIDSNAAKTQIGNITIKAEDFVPVKTSSSNIILEKVNIEAAGYAMLSSEAATLKVSGTNNIVSNGDNAIVCKGFDITATKADAINIYGNVYYYGTKPESEQLTVSRGELIEITEEQFNNYIKGTVDVIFDANEGTLAEEESTKTVFYGNEIGELPTPTRDYYTFAGWFDAAEGGNEYISTDEIKSATSITLYAHWTQNEAKWALATEVPDGAEILSRAWDCDKTTNTTKESSSRTAPTVDGFTLYNTVRTGWGSKQGPVYTNPSDGSRNVTSESYISSYGTKWVVRYYRYAPNFASAGSSTQTSYYCNLYYHDADYTPINGSGTAGYNNKGVVYYGIPSGYSSYCYYAWEDNGYWYRLWPGYSRYETDYSKPNYSTRWYYQEPIYTYYYTKTEHLTDLTADPTGTDGVSNVVARVQYRAK